jgi:hypothetical protein
LRNHADSRPDDRKKGSKNDQEKGKNHQKEILIDHYKNSKPSIHPSNLGGLIRPGENGVNPPSASIPLPFSVPFFRKKALTSKIPFVTDA